MTKSLSFVKGSGNLNHNNRSRDSISENVDITRTGNNIIIIQENLKEAYEKEFGEAVKNYNEKQKRKDRKIKNYLDKIKKSENGEQTFYELIIQIGDKKDTNCKDNPKKEIEVLEQYAREFQERNPNLKMFNAVIHLDEETPHLHLDYIPFAEYQKGLKKRNSLSQALIQQYDLKVDKNNKKDKTGIFAAEKFFEIERTVLKEMCLVAAIELTPSKKSNRDNYSVKEYKELQERKEYYQEDILKLEENLKKKKDISWNFEKSFTGKNIITDNQIDKINEMLKLEALKLQNEQNEKKILLKEINRIKEQRDYFKKKNLTRLFELQEKELIAANEKIKKLELAAQKKKELEDLKAKEYADKKLDRIKQKEFQDSKNLRLEKFDRQLSNRINEDAYELFYEQFGDIKKGSVVKADVFEDFVFKVIEHLKEKYKEFSELLNYKNFQGEEINMIEEEVGYAEDDYKEKTHSKQR